MQRHGTDRPLEPRPLAPPLGRPPPPPPPAARPLAPPLGQPPPPPPPPLCPPVMSSSSYPTSYPPPPPMSHPPPPPTSHPPPPPTSHPPPPPTSHPSPPPTSHLPPLPPTHPPSSTLVPPPPPPAPHHPPLPPQPHNPPHPPHPPQPHKEETDSQTSPKAVTHPAAVAALKATSSFSKKSEEGGSKEHTSADKPKGFGGMKFRGSETVLGKRAGGSISMKIGKTQVAPDTKKAKVVSPPIKKTALVSQAFGDESDEEEEMPPEAKLRMRNLGKDTPTSSGPNSFHKTKMGFSDPRAGYKRYYYDDD